MSPKDTSSEEEGVDADGVDQDGAEREVGAAKSVCRDRNQASLRLMVAQSMAHMMEKMVGQGKRNGKMAQNPRDNGRKDELITGHRIQMNVYDRQNEV